MSNISKKIDLALDFLGSAVATLYAVGTMYKHKDLSKAFAPAARFAKSCVNIGVFCLTPIKP